MLFVFLKILFDRHTYRKRQRRKSIVQGALNDVDVAVGLKSGVGVRWKARMDVGDMLGVVVTDAAIAAETVELVT